MESSQNIFPHKEGVITRTRCWQNTNVEKINYTLYFMSANNESSDSKQHASSRTMHGMSRLKHFRDAGNIQPATLLWNMMHFKWISSTHLCVKIHLTQPDTHDQVRRDLLIQRNPIVEDPFENISSYRFPQYLPKLEWKSTNAFLEQNHKLTCESLEICARTHWVPDPQYGTGSIFSRFTNLRLSSTWCIQTTSWSNLKSIWISSKALSLVKALFSLRNFLTNPSSQPCISGNRLESRYHAVPAKLKKPREKQLGKFPGFPWSRSCWGLEDGENESRFEC